MTTANLLVLTEIHPLSILQARSPKIKGIKVVLSGVSEGESSSCLSFSYWWQSGILEVLLLVIALLLSLPLSSHYPLLSSFCVTGRDLPFFHKEVVIGFRQHPKSRRNYFEILSYICTIQPTILGRGISMCQNRRW